MRRNVSHEQPCAHSACSTVHRIVISCPCTRISLHRNISKHHTWEHICFIARWIIYYHPRGRRTCTDGRWFRGVVTGESYLCHVPGRGLTHNRQNFIRSRDGSNCSFRPARVRVQIWFARPVARFACQTSPPYRSGSSRDISLYNCRFLSKMIFRNREFCVRHVDKAVTIRHVPRFRNVGKNSTNCGLWSLRCFNSSEFFSREVSRLQFEAVFPINRFRITISHRATNRTFDEACNLILSVLLVTKRARRSSPELITNTH